MFRISPHVPVGRIKLDFLPPKPEGVHEDSVLSVFRVPDDAGGMRVDQYLRSELRRTTRARANAIVQASAFDLEGRRLRPGSRVRAGALLLLWRPPWDEAVVPTEIPVVYEDAHLFAVNKPPNLPVHPTTRYHKNTLIKLLEMERPGQWLSLGHRLDRETSGLLLVSKSLDCDRALKRAIEARADIEKTYRAITWGIPEGLELGVPWRFECPLVMDERSRIKVKVRPAEADDETPLHAATVFTLEEVRTSTEGRRYGRIRCDLETGRQHQIRVHLAALGCPIVGDKLYGPDEQCFARNADGELTEDDRQTLELDRHALHALRLVLPHPLTGERLEIEAPWSTDLEQFWQSLRSLP